jgi:hypothetical protein
MLHRDGRICGQEHKKTDISMDYNATKRGVDNLDKLVTGNSCKRRTLQWPLVIFFNILDILAYKAFVIWMVLNLDWNRGKLQRRRLFLEKLGLGICKIFTVKVLNTVSHACSINNKQLMNMHLWNGR